MLDGDNPEVEIFDAAAVIALQIKEVEENFARSFRTANMLQQSTGAQVSVEQNIPFTAGAELTLINAWKVDTRKIMKSTHRNIS